ncbi:MAG: Gmad2 immunoglobulin-like domain-containing protein [Acidimicrobiales bacterium]
MTAEDRLRQAIEARTASIEPSLDDGLERIEAKLAAPSAPSVPSRTPSKTWLMAAAILVVVVAAVTAGLALRAGEDGNDVDISNEPVRPDTDPSDTMPAPSTTETPSTVDSTTTTAPPGSQPSDQPSEEPSTPPADVVAQAVWPRPSSDVRFDDPVAAARSFALYLAQFAEPVVGEFRAGDSRSGEVPVQPTAGGPETTVLVRQLSDDHWYVIGSTTADITVDQPTAGAALASPQPLSGQALAFEGNVQVQLLGYLPDGRSERLGLTSVTGSGTPPAGPFTGTLDWASGSADLEPTGVLVFWTSDESLEIGGSLQVVAFPVTIRG